MKRIILKQTKSRNKVVHDIKISQKIQNKNQVSKKQRYWEIVKFQLFSYKNKNAAILGQPGFQFLTIRVD